MIKSIDLYCQVQGSDKVYRASIEPSGSGFVVNYGYAKRGQPLKLGTKTVSPVDLTTANKIYESLVQEKMKGGYQLVQGQGDSDSYIMVNEANDSGLRCQLLNPVEESEVGMLLNDDDYLMQEKKDGERRMLAMKSRKVSAINRKGLLVGFPALFESLSRFNTDFVIDAEIIDKHLHSFDILEFNGMDLRPMKTVDRLAYLEKFHSIFNHAFITTVETANSTWEKQELFQKLKKRNAEGVVFKLKSAPYSPGRPASGGDHLKFKFYSTASFEVLEVNNKRSVLLGLYREGSIVPAGNVTIPINHEIPNVGDIVEVRYLYAYKESGSVFQPVYLGKRNDIDRFECQASQLKFKADE